MTAFRCIVPACPERAEEGSRYCEDHAIRDRSQPPAIARPHPAGGDTSRGVGGAEAGAVPALEPDRPRTTTYVIQPIDGPPRTITADHMTYVNGNYRFTRDGQGLVAAIDADELEYVRPANQTDQEGTHR